MGMGMGMLRGLGWDGSSSEGQATPAARRCCLWLHKEELCWLFPGVDESLLLAALTDGARCARARWGAAALSDAQRQDGFGVRRVLMGKAGLNCLAVASARLENKREQFKMCSS